MEKKDPDIWEPPTPFVKKAPPQNKWNAKKKLNMQKPSAPPSNRQEYGAGFAPNIKKIGPQVAKQGGGGGGAKEEKKGRNYDKPWLVPEKEKKEP